MTDTEAPPKQTLIQDVETTRQAILTAADVLGSQMLHDAANALGDIVGRLEAMMKALEFHKTVILQDIDDTKAHAARLTASTQKLAVAHIAAIETDAKVAVDSKFNAGQMLNDILADIGKR